MGRKYEASALRMPVAGVLRWAKSDHRSAQLRAYDPESFNDRPHASRRSFRGNFAILHHEAIYMLPLSGYRNLTAQSG